MKHWYKSCFELLETFFFFVRVFDKIDQENWVWKQQSLSLVLDVIARRTDWKYKNEVNCSQFLFAFLSLVYPAFFRPSHFLYAAAVSIPSEGCCH